MRCPLICKNQFVAIVDSVRANDKHAELVQRACASHRVADTALGDTCEGARFGATAVRIGVCRCAKQEAMHAETGSSISIATCTYEDGGLHEDALQYTLFCRLTCEYYSAFLIFNKARKHLRQAHLADCCCQQSLPKPQLEAYKQAFCNTNQSRMKWRHLSHTRSHVAVPSV